MKTLITLTVALLAVAPSALGAEPDVEPALAAAAHADAIAPFVDPLTVLIARLDLARIDPDAALGQIEAWQKAAIPDPKELRESVTEMRKELQTAKKRLLDLRKTGAREMYVVFSVASFPGGSPTFYVVPVGPGVDSEAVERLYREWDGPKKASNARRDPDERAATATVTAQMHGAIVAADATTLKRLEVLEPAAQPQVQAAFQTVPGAAAQVLLVPSQDVRAVLAAMMPMGDAPEMERLREPIQTMIRTLQWAAAGLDMPPRTGVRLVVQTTDGQGARDVQLAMRRVFDFGMEKALTKGEDHTGIIRVLQQVLLPEPKGTQLMRAIGNEQIEAVIVQLAPSLGKARKQAKKSFSTNNIAQFVRALHIYQGEKKAWPDSFHQMMVVAMRMQIEPGDDSPDILKNPQRPDMRPAYVYIKPGLPMTRIANPGEMVVFYERYDEWGDGINVGFLDGHVIFVGDQVEFEKMLARTRAMDPGGTVAEVATTQKASTK
jgi:prepilin-type processing-associated H-X9-DG protein